MSVMFTLTKLDNKNLKGVLEPDENGYYEMVIGGLNVFSSNGHYYTAEKARSLFEKSSEFMRRVSTGNLRGEVNHPDISQLKSREDQLNRLVNIDSHNVCAHFSDIWLDEDYGKKHPELNNPSLVAIMAKVTPSGEKGYILEKAFKNPKENVCFSLRGVTEDYMERGVYTRVVDYIFTFDYVQEPGIHIANKFDSPCLESIDDMVLTESLVERVSSGSSKGIATEESSKALQDINKIFTKKGEKPVTFRW